MSGHTNVMNTLVYVQIQDDDGITIAENQEWICKQKGGFDISVDILKR